MAEILKFEQPSLFDESAIPPEEAAWLREREEKIISYCRRTLEDHVRAGEVLLDVFNNARGHFKGWLQARTPLSRSTAYCLMSVAEQFKNLMLEMSAGRTKNIEVKALYALCQPGVPKEARVKAVEMAQKDESVSYTLDMARTDIWIEKNKRKSPARKGTVERYAEQYEKDFQSDHEARRKTLFNETDTAPPDETREARAIRSLKELVRLSASVTIGEMEDEEGDAPLFFVRAIFKDKNRQMPPASVRADIIDAIEAVLGREEQKKCPQCGEVRTMDRFTANQTKTDGVASECKICSRRRIRESKLRKKQQPEQAA